MTLSQDDRAAFAKAFNEAIPTIEEMFHIYAARVNAPARFAISLFDASDGGPSWLAGGEPEQRAIVEHEIRTADWEDRNFTATARRKTRGAIRTGRNSGDLVRNAKELFVEGDAQNPGACLDIIDGNPICVASSGLRGTEDETFSLMLIELLKRILTPPAS
jgi:hypothetical protein